jgi:thiol peroxidase
MIERKEAAVFGNKAFTLVGPEVKPGDKAPAFSVIAADKSVFTQDNLIGKPTILCSIPSVDTGVCDRETKRFNDEAKKLGAGVQIALISVDLPLRLKSWCGSTGVENVKLYSDHREVSFGVAFGTLMKEARLLSRAVFVTDKDGVVRHVEYVREASNEPNYDKAIDAAKKLM